MSDSLITIDNAQLFAKAMEGIEEEIVGDHVSMLRDLVKGAHRKHNDLKKQVEALQKEMTKIEQAIETAKGGDLNAVKDIEIPARYLDEKTVRLARMDWRTEDDE